GVDLYRFTPRDLRTAKIHWGIDEGAFVVASVGRLSQEKGHTYVLEALGAVRRVIPSLKCLIAGDGPLRHALERQVGALGLEDVCVFLGNVPEIERVYAAADVTVLASLFEGMPNVILEAMAMGCPAVATAVGGSTELVRPGETGLIVRPADSEALAAALRELWDNPGRRNAMRERSRRVAESAHGIERMVAAVEDLYVREWEWATA